MKVLICGAGIAGLTLAWHLERAGCEVLLVERAPAFREGGYMIDFYGAGYQVAEQMGLAARLRAQRCPVTGLAYRDRAGRRTSGLDITGSMANVVSILRGDLSRTIYDDVRSPVRYGTSVAGFTQSAGAVDVELTDGSRHTVDLLVGADGVNSRVRALTFGPAQRYLRYLGHHVAAYIVDDERLARQVGTRYEMLTVPGRTAGGYALRDGRLALLFLHGAADPKLPDDPAAALRRRYGDLGWILPDVLAACPQPPELYYDQVAQVEMPQWSDGRVVLLGDACQAVSLFAGHGASMAMAAAHVLAEELAGERGDLSAALQRYQGRMEPAIADTQRLGRSVVEWMAPADAWRITARDWIMRLAGLPGLDRLLLNALTPGGHGLIRTGQSRSVQVPVG